MKGDSDKNELNSPINLAIVLQATFTKCAFHVRCWAKKSLETLWALATSSTILLSAYS